MGSTKQTRAQQLAAELIREVGTKGKAAKEIWASEERGQSGRPRKSGDAERQIFLLAILLQIEWRKKGFAPPCRRRLRERIVWACWIKGGYDEFGRPLLEYDEHGEQLGEYHTDGKLRGEWNENKLHLLFIETPGEDWHPPLLRSTPTEVLTRLEEAPEPTPIFSEDGLSVERVEFPDSSLWKGRGTSNDPQTLLEYDPPLEWGDWLGVQMGYAGELLPPASYDPNELLPDPDD
jgi:hypothetical protein